MQLLEVLPFIVGLVFLPLTAALAAFVLRRWSLPIAALGAMGAMLCLSGLTWQVVHHGPQRYHVGGWRAPLGIQLHADGLSVVLLATTAIVMGIVGLYSRWFLRSPRPPSGSREDTRALILPLGLFLWAALNALFLSGDAFNLYVTFELLGLAAVALTSTGGKAAIPAAFRYLLASLLGSLTYLLGVAILYASYATLDLASLAQATATGSGAPLAAAPLAAALMVTGLALKTALVPLHFWLPAAHANAPAPVSALLSGLVVKASFYVLLRLWIGFLGNTSMSSSAQLIGALGAASVVWGSVMALRQERLKLLIAYSTIAQLGYLFMVVPLLTSSARAGALQAAASFILAHGCAKAAMFLVAGNIIFAAGHDRIAELGSILPRMPLSATAFGLAGMSLVGMPPSGGFAAKWTLLSAALQSGQWWWALVLWGGGLLAGAYVFRVMQRAFGRSTTLASFRKVPCPMEWIALALALLSLAAGGSLPALAGLLGGVL